MQTLSRLILTLLALGLVLAAVPAVFTLPAELILFQASSYQQAMRSEGVYEGIPAWAAEMLAVQGNLLAAGSGAQSGPLQYVDQAEFERITRLLLPQEWIEEQGDSLLRQGWDALNFRTSELALDVDLTPLKARLAGSEGRELVNAILVSWPACSLDMVQNLLLQLLAGSLQGIPVCRPPEQVLPYFEGALQASVQGLAASLPDRVSLANVLNWIDLGQDPQMQARRELLFTVYRAVRIVLRFAPVICVVLMVGMAVFSITRPGRLLGAWGAALLAAGIIALLLAAFLLLSGNLGAELVVRQLLPARPEGMFRALVGVVRVVGSRFLVVSSVAAVVVAALGAGLGLVARGMK